MSILRFDGPLFVILAARRGSCQFAIQFVGRLHKPTTLRSPWPPLTSSPRWRPSCCRPSTSMAFSIPSCYSSPNVSPAAQFYIPTTRQACVYWALSPHWAGASQRLDFKLPNDAEARREERDSHGKSTIAAWADAKSTHTLYNLETGEGLVRTGSALSQAQRVPFSLT